MTDADPEIANHEEHWKKQLPEIDETSGKYKLSPRALAVRNAFTGQANICVEISELTLEYDMALAGPDNALFMYDAWASCYATKPKQLARAELEGCNTAEERAMMLWRAVCRGSPQPGKAALAQALASALAAKDASPLHVPDYIARAIRHAAREPKP